MPLLPIAMHLFLVGVPFLLLVMPFATSSVVATGRGGANSCHFLCKLLRFAWSYIYIYLILREMTYYILWGHGSCLQNGIEWMAWSMNVRRKALCNCCLLFCLLLEPDISQSATSWTASYLQLSSNWCEHWIYHMQAIHTQCALSNTFVV